MQKARDMKFSQSSGLLHPPNSAFMPQENSKT